MQAYFLAHPAQCTWKPIINFIVYGMVQRRRKLQRPTTSR